MANTNLNVKYHACIAIGTRIIQLNMMITINQALRVVKLLRGKLPRGLSMYHTWKSYPEPNRRKGSTYFGYTYHNY